MLGHLRRRWAGLAVLAAGVPSLGCYATNSYTLKLDGAAPANSQLCERSSRRDSAEVCGPLAGEALEAPGVLAVQVVNTVADEEYTVRLEETVRGASADPTPNEVVQEVASRLTGLSKDFVGPLDGEKEAAVESGRRLLTRVSRSIADERPAVAAALAGIAQPAVAELGPDHDPAGVFSYWLDEANGAFKERAGTVLGSPGSGYAPPRIIRLGPDDLTYLASKRIDGNELARFSIRWCKVESFGSSPFGSKKPWLHEPPPWQTPTELLSQLSLGPAEVRTIVREGGSDLGARIGAALVEANIAAKRGAEPSVAAQSLYHLFAVSHMASDLGRCAANLEFLAGAGSLSQPVLKDVQSELPGLAAAGEKLRATANAARLFDSAIAPLAEHAAIEELTQSGNGGTLAFGTYTLHPGRLSLSVSSKSGQHSAEPIAQLELAVQSSGPVSVSVGPVISVCSKCMHSVTERFTVVDEGGTTSVRRGLADDTSSSSIGYAAMLHYSLFGGTRNQVGLALGYPLADQTGTALGVLAGVSYRNTVGIQVSLGAHLFETKEPTQELPLDVSADSAVAITADDVTQRAIATAYFVFFGATSDLFYKP
jgi:hypothetical protein